MECKSCKKLRKYLNESGICVICEYGHGGNTKEIKSHESICIF